MARIRRDVWTLNQPWDDILLWYARGVGRLKERRIAERNSWTFLGAMHGFDQALWTAFDYIAPSEPLPPASDRNQFWAQCQHQTWYFLPWHRGYLAAFEAAVRAEIVALGGPPDWALPYWNYSDSQSNPDVLKLPPAFAEPRLPDGSDNPLAEPRRYGDGTGVVVLAAEDVTLGALKQDDFEGAVSGGSTGFGGVRTAFRHGGPRSANGQLERQPHNGVHGLVGGRIPDGDPEDARSYGLMSLPDTSALDPIFWLHHANIDRLWEVWLQRRPGKNVNPDDTDWLNGPADRSFIVPLPDGSTWTFSASEVLDTQAPRLDYSYQNTADPFGGVDFLALRLTRLGAPARAAAGISRGPAMPRRAEKVGENNGTLRLEGSSVETHIQVDRDAATRTMSTLRAEPDRLDTFAPDRVFLNLENIRGINDAALFHVYASHPRADLAPALVGTVSLFGVRKATALDDAHSGNGISESLDITDWVDQLRAAGVQDLDDLKIQLVPRTDIRPEDGISVGRISLYRQGR